MADTQKLDAALLKLKNFLSQILAKKIALAKKLDDNQFTEVVHELYDGNELRDIVLKFLSTSNLKVSTPIANDAVNTGVKKAVTDFQHHLLGKLTTTECAEGERILDIVIKACKSKEDVELVTKYIGEDADTIYKVKPIISYEKQVALCVEILQKAHLEPKVKKALEKTGIYVTSSTEDLKTEIIRVTHDKYSDDFESFLTDVSNALDTQTILSYITGIFSKPEPKFNPLEIYKANINIEADIEFTYSVIACGLETNFKGTIDTNTFRKWFTEEVVLVKELGDDMASIEVVC